MTIFFIMNFDRASYANPETREKEVPLYQVRWVDRRSLMGLYFSQILLCLGFLLILMNNLSILAPGSYFGAFNWVTVIVFSIGLVINFVLIPFLYFSSYSNFKKENDFWDRQIFWILPLFFFGTFFLYGSEISFAVLLLIISVLVISVVHSRFFLLSKKFKLETPGETLASYDAYFTSLKYLTAYYMLLLALLVSMNPIQQLFVWIRMHT